MDCIVTYGLVHETVEFVCYQNGKGTGVPGRVGGGRRLAKQTIEWPLLTQCIALNQESLPPLMSATHFIVWLLVCFSQDSRKFKRGDDRRSRDHGNFENESHDSR